MTVGIILTTWWRPCSWGTCKHSETLAHTQWLQHCRERGRSMLLSFPSTFPHFPQNHFKTVKTRTYTHTCLHTYQVATGEMCIFIYTTGRGWGKKNCVYAVTPRHSAGCHYPTLHVTHLLTPQGISWLKLSRFHHCTIETGIHFNTM